MNSCEQQQRARANKCSASIRKDSLTYIEGFGKDDVDVFGSDLEAKDVVLRLVLGATIEMPARARSYIESAGRIALHIPHAQLQIVHANSLGNKINGIDKEGSAEAAATLSEHTIDMIRRLPMLEDRILHAVDTPHHTDEFLDAAHAALALDATLRLKMGDKGSKHGGDSVRYIAGHFAFQDTDDLELDPIIGAEQTSADSIISIGCQQERLFYRARMGMRQVVDPSVNTGQIFTKHITPPYFVSRGGEPLLGEVIDLSAIGDASTIRDLSYLEESIKESESQQNEEEENE